MWDKPSTKAFKALIEALKIDRTCLVAFSDTRGAEAKSAANLEHVDLTQIDRLNAFDLLTGADPEDCILTSEDEGISLPEGASLETLALSDDPCDAAVDRMLRRLNATWLTAWPSPLGTRSANWRRRSTT